MFFFTVGCFCLFSIILIISPFWLAKNEKIQTSALKKGLEHVKMLKEETLSFWIYDEKRYKRKLLTDEDWQRRKMELKKTNKVKSCKIHKKCCVVHTTLCGSPFPHP